MVLLSLYDHKEDVELKLPVITDKDNLRLFMSFQKKISDIRLF